MEGTAAQARRKADAAGAAAGASGGRALAAAALAAVGASLCCVGPFVLLALGFGGAWMANLRVLEPWRPLLIGAVLVFLGLAFHRLYVRPRRCAPGEACAPPSTLRRQRRIFWAVTVLAAALVAFPWYGPLLIG